MIKKIFISACLLLSLVSFAQEGSSSPYSFYGIGEVRFKGTAEMRAMAGVGVEQDSIHINLDNPASYANLKLTSFTIGGTYSPKTLKDNSKSESTKRTTIDYLAVGLPLGKIGVGFGLIPYSSVGYKIESLSSVDDGFNYRYNGTGGLNKAFVGIGYKIAPNFSIGADVNYNFGKIETNSIVTANNVVVGTSETSTADLSGVNFNIGAMYQTKISDKLNGYGSITYTLQNKLNSTNTSTISTFYNSTLDVLNEDQESTRTLNFPSKLSVSAGLGEARKWLIGGKVSYQKSTAEANSYNDLPNVGYGRYGSVSLGGYYIPDYGSFNSYLKRIVYRGGLKFEKTGLVINSESIDDMALTLGIGMPITGTFSNVNIGLELGKKGTTNAGLVQENYANISIGLSFNDKWFQKRKFD